MPRVPSILLGLAWLATAVAATSGCGRKGALDAPPSAVVEPRPIGEQAPVSQRRNGPGNIDSILDADTGGGP